VLVDGHEDLALNVVSYGRDYLTSARAIRAAEGGAIGPGGACMLGLEDWRAAGVGLVFATIAVIPAEHGFPREQTYATAGEAHAAARAQLAVYERWDASDVAVRIVRARADLHGDGVGLVLLMENADPILGVEELGWWRRAGVRVVGPAWHANRYSADTREPGPLTPLGRALVPALGEAGMALDLTHMAEEACFEALELSAGPVCATHAHARRTCDIPRLLSDRLVRAVAARDGVVGVLPVCWALREGWRRGDPRVPLDRVVDAVVDLCDLTGGVRHVAVGTDFDGGQGAESAPLGIETIADLPRLGDALVARGFSDDEAAAVLGGNWLRWLRGTMPA
jgi:membrane dipeptidase